MRQEMATRQYLLRFFNICSITVRTQPANIAFGVLATIIAAKVAATPSPPTRTALIWMTKRSRSGSILAGG